MQTLNVFSYKNWMASSARSAFLRGVGHAFGMRGLTGSYPIAWSAEEAQYRDYLALKSDWEEVGKDLAWAIHEVGRTLPEQSR
ncbi:MAG: hypothetical protein OXB89_03735 [Anaerolineaceae bacterium]|nr:hypothetical protein [Anaerolineaceae bacterium]